MFHLTYSIDGATVIQVQAGVHTCSLRAPKGQRLIKRFKVRAMLANRHSGFVLDAPWSDTDTEFQEILAVEPTQAPAFRRPYRGRPIEKSSDRIQSLRDRRGRQKLTDARNVRSEETRAAVVQRDRSYTNSNCPLHTGHWIQ